MAERMVEDLEVSSGRRCARTRAGPCRIVNVNDMVVQIEVRFVLL